MSLASYRAAPPRDVYWWSREPQHSCDRLADLAGTFILSLGGGFVEGRFCQAHAKIRPNARRLKLLQPLRPAGRGRPRGAT